jgi:predicted transcriptional regulator
MKHYRSRTEIISQILEIANGGGATKSKIMYKALLDYDQLKEYLMLLAKGDLLHYDFLTRTFKTTEKGLKFLNFYNQIERLMNEGNKSRYTGEETTRLKER